MPETLKPAANAAQIEHWRSRQNQNKCWISISLPEFGYPIFALSCKGFFPALANQIYHRPLRCPIWRGDAHRSVATVVQATSIVDALPLHWHPSWPTKKRRPGIVHSSIHLPEALYEALREVAFRERWKIHDIVLEGIEMALRNLSTTNEFRSCAESSRRDYADI
jgi:hypothetical protein